MRKTAKSANTSTSASAAENRANVSFACPGRSMNPPSRPSGVRRVAHSNTRRSVMPSSIDLNATRRLDMSRRVESEANNNEDLLYDDYLQIIMSQCIVEQKKNEREKQILMKLACLEKKQEDCELKLHEIKQKMHGFESLNRLHQYGEIKVEEMRAFVETYNTKLTDCLESIYSTLKIFDKLSCKNIIIPESEKDLESLSKMIENGLKLLNVIDNIIGDKAEKIVLTNENLHEFKNNTNTAEKQLTLLREDLQNLHIVVLTSFSLFIDFHNL